MHGRIIASSPRLRGAATTRRESCVTSAATPCSLGPFKASHGLCGLDARGAAYGIPVRNQMPLLLVQVTVLLDQTLREVRRQVIK
jgi:hypothetical protein